MNQLFPRYNVNYKSVYYVTPKCASRSFFKIFQFECNPNNEIKKNSDDYFSWSFIRNPYARIVSAYQNKIVDKHEFGLEQFRSIDSFREFVFELNNIDLTISDRHIRPLYTFLPKSIDYIGRVENIQNDFDVVCNEIGLKNVKLPHVNKSVNKHYSSYYDVDTIKLIKRLYQKDLELFEYKFENQK
jgi:chondroitin 4-sulfotransferase 11